MSGGTSEKNGGAGIAYCGLDCRKCDAYRATVLDDDALREATARSWSQLNNASITPEMINCLGCRGEGIKTPFCELWCGIRPCAREKSLDSCGSCGEKLHCEKLAVMAGSSPEIWDNLVNA